MTPLRFLAACVAAGSIATWTPTARTVRAGPGHYCGLDLATSGLFRHVSGVTLAGLLGVGARTRSTERRGVRKAVPVNQIC